jgi:hypothetical protein
MQALKTVVIVLGFIIVAGFGLLIFGLTQNWHRPAETAAPALAPPTVRVPMSGSGWGSVTLSLPANAKIRSVIAAGPLVVVHVEGSPEQLITLNPATGAVVGTFTVPAP